MPRANQPKKFLFSADIIGPPNINYPNEKLRDSEMRGLVGLKNKQIMISKHYDINNDIKHYDVTASEAKSSPVHTHRKACSPSLSKIHFK